MCHAAWDPHQAPRRTPLLEHTLHRPFPPAIAKYGKGQATDDLATAVEMLFERNLTTRLPLMARVSANDFRAERMYTEEVDLLLRKHQVGAAGRGAEGGGWGVASAVAGCPRAGAGGAGLMQTSYARLI